MRFRVWIESEEMIPVKNVRQSHNYDCGAAALKSISHFYDVPLENEREFIKLCKTGKRKGTNPKDLVKGAQKLGLSAKILDNMTIEQLKGLLDKKTPVICAIQAWGDKEDYDEPESGHYVIAIGYDDKNMYFEDPSLRMSRGKIPVDEFLDRWHDQEAFTQKIQKRMGIVVTGNKPVKPDYVKSAKHID